MNHWKCHFDLTIQKREKRDIPTTCFLCDQLALNGEVFILLVSWGKRDSTLEEHKEFKDFIIG